MDSFNLTINLLYALCGTAALVIMHRINLGRGPLDDRVNLWLTRVIAVLMAGLVGANTAVLIDWVIS